MEGRLTDAKQGCQEGECLGEERVICARDGGLLSTGDMFGNPSAKFSSHRIKRWSLHASNHPLRPADLKENGQKVLLESDNPAPPHHSEVPAETTQEILMRGIANLADFRPSIEFSPFYIGSPLRSPSASGENRSPPFLLMRSSSFPLYPEL
ncbi:hypothetical protein CEXT_409411 [Caerostris extrusa]|uniref:Uncharacterized protein n=1 Tax=Caerostris extrusa TaxID=172846 RepID=A0AAV4RXN6_CAEEX|nr:hypothetical protein CEXT_409411 [Caerostris extrusa]